MSNHPEIEWDDIREFATVGYIGGGFILTGLYYEKMDDLANKTAHDPRTAWRMRPAIAAAKQISKIGKFVDDHEGAALTAAIGCCIAGLAAGIAATTLAAPWLGATWAAIFTLKGFGLCLGALGIGAAVAPLAAGSLALGVAVVAPTTVLLARGWGDIKSEMILGREETREWKKEQAAAVGGPHPLVTAAANSKGEMAAQGQLEREKLFRRLQAKFPAEFAEAVRRSDTDTVLRDKVQIMKPVKFNLQQKNKTLLGRMGGAA